MYQIAIIGSGPGGIEAAKQAIKAGKKTILFEKDISSFGGTCLNRGCIPTKFFLHNLDKKLSWEEIYINKEKLINNIKNEALTYLQRQGLEVIFEQAKIKDKNTLAFSDKVIKSENIIIATGSKPNMFFDYQPGKIIPAEEIFSLAKLPQEKILIIGAGAIGLELACLLIELGKQVVVIELEKEILPRNNSPLKNRLKIILEKKGINFILGKKADKQLLKDFDLVLIAAGRKPNYEQEYLLSIGIDTDDLGWIKVNNVLQTSLENVYACGDCNGKYFYAYTAEVQARLILKNIILAKNNRLDLLGLSECIFTRPQFAFINPNLPVLAEDRQIKGFLRNYSSSYVYDDTEGIIHLVIDKQNRIKSVSMISEHASELIGYFSLAIREKIPLDNLAKLSFIHPTISEIIPALLRNSF